MGYSSEEAGEGAGKAREKGMSGAAKREYRIRRLPYR